MRHASIVALTIAFVATWASPSAAQSRSAAAFEKLKSLAGTWDAKAPDGSGAVVSYEVTSNGSAVLERIVATGENMITMYHQDGDRLVMTHYCAAGNQPRMVADVPTGEIKSLTFRFLDVTNLASPSASYMNGLTISFLDAAHVTTTWSDHEGDKDVAWTFQLERRK